MEQGGTGTGRNGTQLVTRAIDADYPAIDAIELLRKNGKMRETSSNRSVVARGRVTRRNARVRRKMGKTPGNRRPAQGRGIVPDRSEDAIDASHRGASPTFRDAVSFVRKFHGERLLSSFEQRACVSARNEEDSRLRGFFFVSIDLS